MVASGGAWPLPMLRPLYNSTALRTLWTLLLAAGLTVGLTCALAPLRSALADASSTVRKTQGPQLQARALFKEAEDLQKAGDLKGALAKLEEAYQVLPTPTLLWPIAELHLQLEQPLEGLDAIRRYRQEMVPTEMEPGQQTSDADKLEEKLREKLAYLNPVAPDGVLISVDGKEIGRTPLHEKAALNPGVHRVTTSGKGAIPEASVELKAGQQSDVSLVKEPSRRSGYFPHPLTWAAIGVTTAALLATTIVGGIALSDTRNLDSTCINRVCLGGTNQNIQQLNSQVSQQRTFAITADVLLGVTSLFAVGTTVLIIYDWQRQRSGRTLLSERRVGSHLSLLGPVPMVGGDGAGFALGGRF